MSKVDGGNSSSQYLGAAKKFFFEKLKSSATKNQEEITEDSLYDDKFWLKPISNFFNNQMESTKFISGLTEGMEQYQYFSDFSLGGIVHKHIEIVEKRTSGKK